jgi:hypothetical protein
MYVTRSYSPQRSAFYRSHMFGSTFLRKRLVSSVVTQRTFHFWGNAFVDSAIPTQRLTVITLHGSAYSKHVTILLGGIPIKWSPWVWGRVNALGIQCYLFAQSMCPAKMYWDRPLLHDGSGEVLHLVGSKSLHHQTSLQCVFRRILGASLAKQYQGPLYKENW